MNSIGGNAGTSSSSRKVLVVMLFVTFGVFLGGCGVGPTGALSCSATGTTINSAQVSNVSVYISNGNGPFNVSVAGATQQSSSSTFTYPGTVTAGSAVTVTDNSNQATTSCVISAAGTGVVSPYASTGVGTVTGTGGLYVTASPTTSAAVGTPITLMASSTTGVAASTYSFTLASQPSGVTLSNLGTNEATVTSSIATSVTVMVYAYSNGIQQGTATITLTFGSGLQPEREIFRSTATPSSTTSTGVPIMTLTAYDTSGIANTTFQFVLTNGTGTATVTQTSNNTAMVTSQTGAPVTVTVYELSGGTMVGTNSTLVNFTNSGIGSTTGSIYCTLTATGGTAFAPNVPISFYVTATTGQQLEVVSISPGTSWNNQPSYNMSPSFELEYLAAGTYTVSVVAQTITQPIQTCNATTTITIY